MGMFDNVKSEGLEESQDRLGGFAVLDSDAYTGTIMAAYGHIAVSGAKAVVLHMDFKGKLYNETVYVTNKKGENWYMDNNNKKAQLPGFIIINEICLMTTGKELGDQTQEDKMMNVYDPDLKKEIPKSVPMLVDLMTQDITLGIIKSKVFKQIKNASGDYVDTEETREENHIEKVFHHPSNVTFPEAKSANEKGIDPVADFFPKWVEKNKGTVRDKTSKGSAPKSGGPAPTSGKPTTSLFGKK